MPELDSKDITFHYRGIPTTVEEAEAQQTSNEVFEILSPNRFGVQVQSKAFEK